MSYPGTMIRHMETDVHTLQLTAVSPLERAAAKIQAVLDAEDLGAVAMLVAPDGEERTLRRLPSWSMAREAPEGIAFRTRATDYAGEGERREAAEATAHLVQSLERTAYLALAAAVEIDERLAERRVWKDWQGELAERVDVLAAAFVRHGMERASAALLARIAVQAEAEHHGGRQHYLPKGERMRIAARDAAIYARFDGKNYAQIAREEDMTEANVRRIVRQQREGRRQRAATVG